MVTKKVTLSNEDGLHARAAALFVRTANRYKSEITLTARGESVNAKSIIGIMSLGVFSGEEITITCDGEDETKAVDNLIDLVENKFIMI
ncbi:HPr family phosphocarrier protein [Peptoniphilus indolicus]|uniref:Phosphocarrier protein HPr n=2 Tax=Peptoniphilus indolicus TaxID=33030 RepID=G4D2L6_9FIRM|nr:HPr family phosphocarrier protein [Peptoniphilus indolicus]EGY80229.1 PTS family porter component HPr [Peptoniphilus indolicus ATCC 29427]SUB75270.1 Catabolite repression HPr [Peptoniphilus indolicus]